MPLTITDEHRSLALVARDLAERRHLLRQSQQLLDAPDDSLPELVAEQAQAGFLSLHLPEWVGGQGYGLAELAVVVEELAKAVSPGPFLPTCMASGIIDNLGDTALAERWLPRLATGSAIGAVGFGKWALCGGLADVLVLVDGDDVTVASREEVEITAHANLDHTRRLAEVAVLPGGGVTVRGAAPRATAIARALAAAEASGVAHACTDMAADYAKVREQFGRVIGSFMAVKHHSANMKIQSELATAAAWDGAIAAGTDGAQGELAAAAAAAVAFNAALFCAETNIQVHGGIGYTWEHPAHLFLRRAGALSALFGPAGKASEDVFVLTASGVTRSATVDIPPEAERHRAEVRAFLDELRSRPPGDRRALLVDSGYLVPHWPKPWGREAAAVEQLVIDEEFARSGVNRPDLGIGGWVTLTFTQHGRPEQVQRWTRPSLMGETQWCQLFSEPGAGSDAAGIQTRGTRVEGGWLVNGQKLWTSGAQHCTHGFATVRTDPDAPKHRGITMMAIELKGPGVTIRPLRSIAGQLGFNEVFLDGVFVPDDDVVGQVNDGWSVARATLGNERVTIGAGRSAIRAVDPTRLVSFAESGGLPDRGVMREVGSLIAESQAMKLMNLRSVSRAVLGSEPSPEGNITKLMNSEHAQRVTGLAMRLCGPEAAVTDGETSVGDRWVTARGLTIAGGTSEISRNQIGERLLGLPREPGLR